MVDIEAGLRENTVGAVEQFAAIASADPLAGVMLLCGTIIIAVSMGVFGILTLGGIGAALKSGLSGSEEPNQPV